MFDNLAGTLLLIAHVDPAQQDALQHGQKRLDELAGKLHTAVFEGGKEDSAPGRVVQEADFISGFTQDGFETAVDRIKDYILDGDAMQVVLSQRMSIPYRAAPLDLYRALRSLNPSPYMFYLDLDDSYNFV